MDLTALFSTFGLILVAELGDKTQLAVITQTCKFRRPWPVFIGASLALTLVTLLGALGGELVARLIPGEIIRTVAALAFVLMGLLIAREAYKAGQRAQELACNVDGAEAVCPPGGGWHWKAFSSTAALLFVAELGDKTQLAVLTLASQYGAPVAVFLGGALALSAVTALGVIGGQGLTRIIPERLLLWISAVAFVVMGILMLAGVL